MAANTLGRNIEFPILNADGTPFHDLVIRKATYESVVMSLGDKITGDAFYKDNTLALTMQEYIVFDGVKFGLVDPPTVVREGKVADNGQLNGMTKYSFVFYHPMYQLSNFSFADVAVSSDQENYLSQNKTFSWIGTGIDFIAKLNKNLESTEWIVVASSDVNSSAMLQEMSEVLPFDKNSIADAFKTAYDTWDVPFVISQIKDGEQYYSQGKRFLVTFGLPDNEIYTVDGQGQPTTTPFVFQFGKGVGLKNNSRTPKNNKIITRIAGLGSDRNVPYGYPQIIWTGNQSWNYTINNASGMQAITVGGQTIQAMSYPIYDGVVGGQKVRLIKHPFTRTNLMPSVFVDCVNKKVNPNATGYNPSIEIVDYYDADSSYPNEINPLSPSFEIHQFENIYPRLGDNLNIVQVMAYDDKDYVSIQDFQTIIAQKKATSTNENERSTLDELLDWLSSEDDDFSISNIGGSYTFSIVATAHTYSGGIWFDVKMTSDNVNFEYNVYKGNSSPLTNVEWDDTMNDDGSYVQSYFKLTLPSLGFDLYASALASEEMKINMRSGSCIGCSFPVYIDWDDYKANFYDEHGNFDPVIGEGHPRDGAKYPNSTASQITVIVKKDLDTFGKLMPNQYQTITSNDTFVILGIALPTSYITSAEQELNEAMKQYMLDNNVYYYDYPLKFDEHFLATHQGILAQINNNSKVCFQYAGAEMSLFVKQIVIKYGQAPLPQYDITLTDDIDIVLNKIGQVTEDVSRIRVQLSELQKYYSENYINELNKKLSRVSDDVCQGKITFQQGLEAIGSIICQDDIRSRNYETGLYTGRGWRIDELGNAELESVRVRSFLEVVELIINRLQAQEGDTLYTDNDQIDRVDVYEDENNNTTIYVLSLKEKWEGYITGQKYGNIVKGIINTLAAKGAGVSDESSNNVNNQGKDDGNNLYYTSWMRVINTHNTKNTLGVNQIEVILYGDNDVPSGKNFAPCELMTIARWGCIDYSDESQPNYATVKADIERRQRLFMISTSEGRVIKYTGVNHPKISSWNYGVTIGELPDFVKANHEVAEVLEEVGEHTDWLYAQGIVVQNYVRVSRSGIPEYIHVDCGEWVDGSEIAEPTPRNGIYFYEEWNEEYGQFETHDVWHNGNKWRCLQHQPVVTNGVPVYHEPKWNSVYWKMIEGNGSYTLEFGSSNGFSFRRGAVDTVITPYLFYGGGAVDITDDIADANFSWTRTLEHPTQESQVRDTTWNAQHIGVKSLHLTNNDMDMLWASNNKQIFTCIITINDGNETIIVDNQIIS